MALVNQDLVLDVVPGPIPPILHLTEYDENMEVVVTLQRRGQPFQIPTGTTVKIEGTLKGHPFSENATPSGNTVTFMVSKNMTAYSGRAWTKIKLTQNDKPVSTCGFWLDVDRAGVEAGDVIGSSGFQEQINEGIAEYFDNDPPFFELPSGGQSGQALVSDGNGDAEWGGVPFQLPSGGDAGQALLSDGNNGAYWGKAQDGTGFAATAKRLLLELLRKCIYTEDVEELLSDFEEALNLGVTQDGKKLIIESGVTVTKSGNVLLVS